MNREIEEKFIKNFIVKDKRERLANELSSSKKRESALQKIFDLLDRKFIVLEDASKEELLTVLSKYFNINQNCYVISETDDDGKFLPFEKAFENMLKYEANYFIICTDNTVMACDEYNTFGSPRKILLHK